MEKLDETRVAVLAGVLGSAVRTHMTGQPFHPDKVFEALNAIAIITASVIAGANQDPKVIAFFRLALQEQLNAIVAMDRTSSTGKDPSLN